MIKVPNRLVPLIVQIFRNVRGPAHNTFIGGSTLEFIMWVRNKVVQLALILGTIVLQTLWGPSFIESMAYCSFYFSNAKFGPYLPWGIRLTLRPLNPELLKKFFHPSLE